MLLKPIERKFQINGFYSAFPFRWNEHYTFHGESHDFWEIVFVTAGKVEATEDEKIYTLEKNNIVLHAPMEFHRIRSAGGTRPEGFIMSFASKGNLPNELREGVFVLDGEQAQAYLAICLKAKSLMEETADAPYAGQEAVDLLSAFLIKLSNERTERQLSSSPAAMEYRRTVSVMRERVCDNSTLAELAAACNISVSYLKLLFKKYAGISPKAYYTHLRVRHATKLLGDGVPALEVANQMSFSSPNYFSTFIKKQTGLMPSAHKKARH